MEALHTKEEFSELIKKLQNQKGYRNPIGFGICRVDFGQLNEEKVLQATYPLVNWNENFGSAAVFIAALEAAGEKVNFEATEAVHEVSYNFVKYALATFNPYLDEAVGEAHKNVQVIKMLDEIANDTGLKASAYRVVFLFEDDCPESVESVYLKLYALSQGKAPLRGVNLNGAFGILHNVAWVGNTPVELEWLRANEIELKLRGDYPEVTSVDKFPRFLQHIIPADNTRVLDASKVRMGAQLHPGTTVMPGASYINFNAGTTGPVMVEGRISSSAIVGEGSDVGGGASILGVLSGTNGNPVSIGKNTLLGANSVTGIPLGDGCIVDAGIAVLEGTKFHINDATLTMLQDINPGLEKKADGFYKGLDLAGMHGLHFRYDSVKSQYIVLRSKREVKLNADLH